MITLFFCIEFVYFNWISSVNQKHLMLLLLFFLLLRKIRKWLERCWDYRCAKIRHKTTNVKWPFSWPWSNRSSFWLYGIFPVKIKRLSVKIVNLNRKNRGIHLILWRICSYCLGVADRFFVLRNCFHFLCV